MKTILSNKVLVAFRRILLASMLRDMRTRFGRSYISFVISIAQPLFHLGIMFGIYVLTHRLAPIGDDPAIFAFTGLTPYILCLYPARFTAMAILQNKPLLQFSVISPIHLIVSRAILECLSAVVVFIIFLVILAYVSPSDQPMDIYLAVSTIAATLYFGIAFGCFGITLVSANSMAGLLFIIFSIVILYLLSGAIIPLDFAPQNILDILWYNPLYQAVELMRCSYYSGIDRSCYSLAYIFLIASSFLALGLMGERLLRGKIMT